ncbi:MAG: nucleotide exchange factor GrpE [Wenzhouxiangella sp.]|nr:MAG: nucleotide exchange factor GrpE [Wenzhouxiangella sp.]
MSEPNDREDRFQDEEPVAEPEVESELVEPEPEDSSQSVIAVEEEVGRLRDALLRTRAEMDNLRKRTDRELDKARRFINEALMKDLVPVLDTLDQALENAGADEQRLDQGLRLIQKQLLQSLERHGLAVIDPVGEPFDPEWHEAMSMQPSQEHAADTVMLVLQRGYKLHGRLLRPARVIVSRGAEG